MKPQLTAIPLCLVVAALAAGCGGGPGDRAEAGKPSGQSTQSGGDPAPDAGPAVEIRTFQFQPDPVEIAAGQTVTWTNSDSAVHTVTSGPRSAPDGRFDERLAESGGTTERTFDKPGTYRYFCSLHSGPGMEGEVIVR